MWGSKHRSLVLHNGERFVSHTSCRPHVTPIKDPSMFSMHACLPKKNHAHYNGGGGGCAVTRDRPGCSTKTLAAKGRPAATPPAG